MSTVDRSINRIACAANEYKKDDVYYLILGVRHYDMLMKQTMELINPDWTFWRSLNCKQGFVDKFGTFHDRKSAMLIAKNANQIFDDSIANGEDEIKLYSEHLY